MEKHIDRHDLEWKEEILKQLIAIGDPDEIATFAEEYFPGVIRRANAAEARVRVLEEVCKTALLWFDTFGYEDCGPAVDGKFPVGLLRQALKGGTPNVR